MSLASYIFYKQINEMRNTHRQHTLIQFNNIEKILEVIYMEKYISVKRSFFSQFDISCFFCTKKMEYALKEGEAFVIALNYSRSSNMKII